MKAPRLPEVTARVVAWHNRHPLARRIDPTQVHSIGEVRLPFTSATPWSGGLAAAQASEAGHHPAPTLAEALAQRNARQQSAPAADAGGIEGLDVQSMLPEADADLLASAQAVPAAAADIDLALDVPTTDSAGDDDGEAALVIPLLDGDDAMPAADSTADPPARAATATAPATSDLAGDKSADTGHVPHDAQAAPTATQPGTPATTAEFPDVYPPPHGQVPASALARAVERRAAARGAAAAHDSPPQAADAQPPGRWRRLLEALRLALSRRQRGLPPLRAAFSRDFIWPLRPGQVARWAQRHGQPQPVAPADWPHRSIEVDHARLAALRQKGLAHDLPLHVLSAAIGVGDRRIRVLLGADGSILGPRAYSHTRVGCAAALLAVGLVGAGWSLRPLQGNGADDGAAALAALAASAAVAASAPLAGASAAAESASATALADAASRPGDAASAAVAAASAPGDAHAETSAAATPDPAASQPQADIRPLLSDDDKFAARVEAAKLRGEAPPPPPPDAIQGPVYAVVSPPSRQRDAAAGSLVLMKSAAARLAGPVPAHGELLQSQGQWRAAWWPFASLVDAERARVLLAGRGLKAEVVEF